MPASYPTSAKSFTTKSNSQTIDASHVNDLQLEVTAIESDLIAGLPMTRGGTGGTGYGNAGQVFTAIGGTTAATFQTKGINSAQQVLSVQVFS